MATKQKHRMKHGAAGLGQQAQRSLEKGDFKQALKDAKVWYRQQPGPEARQLLERAYLARGRQLHRAGLQDEARAVAENLLELGTTEASVQQGLPELLIALGLFNRVAAVSGADATLEDGSPLYAAAVDHAVLRPARAPASLPAVRQGAETIHRALAALEAGDEAEAMAALKDIARASAFADWKYFVRGLAAYYRQDAAEMQANWERLDAGRFAAKIAASLRVLADPAVVSIDDFRATDTLARLGAAVLGGPVLARLQTLQGHVVAGRWREAVKLLRAATPVLCQIDSTLPQRLTSILYATLVHKGSPAALRELAAVIEPLPMDPHWNRGLAMAWERLDDEDDDYDRYDNDAALAERHWRSYLDDLVVLDCLLPTERTLARALVWFRLGQMLTEESCPMCSTCGIRHEPDEDIQRRAIDCYENAMKLAPELLAAYQELAEAYREWGDSEHAAATWRRLVQRFPENIETLLFLADHHIRRDEPFAAGEFVFRAQRLKPLDARIKAMARSVRLASARHHALAGRWDEGRAEFAAAGGADGRDRDANGPQLLVCQAALELKAGNMGLANRLLDRACNELGEAAPISLMMAIESRRYALPKAVAEEFEHRWVTVLKKSRRSAAIGEMCRIATAYVTMDIDYLGRDDHLTRLLAFVRRCQQIRKWQAEDLRSVLDFLMVCEHRERHSKETFLKRRNTGGALELLTEFAVKARGKFPENSFFHLMVGETEIRKGPLMCNRALARKCFERVLELAAEGDDSDSIQMMKRARESLDLLREIAESPYDASSRSSPRFVEEDEDDSPYESPFGYSGVGEDEEDGDTPVFSSADLPEALIEKFVQFCREFGVDPEEFMNRAAAAGAPFRFRAKDAPSSKRKKRK